MHHFHQVVFQQVIIDQAFFDNLVSTFDRDIPKALSLEGVLIRNIDQWVLICKPFFILRSISVQNANCACRFIEFVLKWKVHTLSICFANKPLQRALDEKFIREFSSTDEKEYRLEAYPCNFGVVFRHKHRMIELHHYSGSEMDSHGGNPTSYMSLRKIILEHTQIDFGPTEETDYGKIWVISK